MAVGLPKIQMGVQTLKRHLLEDRTEVEDVTTRGFTQSKMIYEDYVSAE